MAFNFKKMAQDALANSFLQSGREKGKWADIDGTEVTIVGMDRNLGPKMDEKTHQPIVNEETGEIEMTLYTTVILAEYPNMYFGGFTQLDRVVDNFAGQFDSFEQLTEELSRAGGIKVKTQMVFRNGKNQRDMFIL